MWVEEAMKDVAKAQLFPSHTHILLMNKNELQRRMQHIASAFNEAVDENCSVQFLHAFAAKANPMQSVLEVARDVGFGIETASIGEFEMACKVFASKEINNEESCENAYKVVFDSPAKTMEELYRTLQCPCYLNADNFAELDRIIALRNGNVPHYPPIEIKAIVGLRINPQTVQQTSNAALATAGQISKFGVSLHDKGNLEQIVYYFTKFHDTINLKMIHVHSGSQGLSLDTMVAGIKTLVHELAQHPQLYEIIEVIDIGGGFPVDFACDNERVNITNYVHALQKQVPELFQPIIRTNTCHNQNRMQEEERTKTKNVKRTIITEFGRTIAAKSGVLISRVEYVKQSGGRQVILQHIGADLAVRTVWQPEKWPLRVFVYDKDGNKKPHYVDNINNKGNNNKADENYSTSNLCVLTDVGGPCCNSGCTLTRAASLPANIVPLSDMIVVHDVGAYYHSSFSLYNLRQMPACYMYEESNHTGIVVDNEKCEMRGTFTCVKKAQCVADTVRLFETDN